MKKSGYKIIKDKKGLNFRRKIKTKKCKKIMDHIRDSSFKLLNNCKFICINICSIAILKKSYIHTQFK